ncbi:hypothetical protein JCM24511_09117 [Saitozyma sp. JCM 24511]|nr:hypothetical protein JCM24511_09117 [Saitozyma sp. JCM 24511]
MALHAAATPRCSSPDGPGGTASTKSLHSCSTPSHSEFPSANASASALNPSKHVLIFTGDSGGHWKHRSRRKTNSTEALAWDHVAGSSPKPHPPSAITISLSLSSPSRTLASSFPVSVSSRGPSDSATASTSWEIEENESCSLDTIERSWGVRELRMEMVSPAENSWEG